ncbi:replication terminator protein [Bacillus sp. 17RED48]|uniref:replication terminator protein n=1 Tax=Bacillus sp. 17RED48 TaxID=2778093 RepID=UPI001C9A7B0A|nr:replication terminator protein [Bacillus sp. 17RED48]MBY7115167.1 replication terminator protein [Bacillus sp. 17RED48]
MNIDLNSLADGAVAEKVDAEFQRVLKNMADPNTDPTKARSITLTLTFKGNKKREIWDCTSKVSSKLVPAKEVESTFIVGRDNGGDVIGRELYSGVKGQMYIDGEGDVATDVGGKVAVEETLKETPKETEPAQIVNWRKTQTN